VGALGYLILFKS